MTTTYTGTVSSTIPASKAVVWDALTNPDAVKEYFFGTELDTDWSVGSPIYFRGEWEGKKYEDKGTIVTFEPEQELSYTYWSSMGGDEDVPENYQTLLFTLSDEGDSTNVTIEQSNTQSQEKIDHSIGNWKNVLEGLKNYVSDSGEEKA